METGKNIETEPELVSPTTEAFRHALQVKIMQRDRIINRVAALMNTQLIGASVHQLEANRMLLEKHFDTFQSLQCEIEMDDHEAFEQSHRDQFEESYCAVKAIIAQRLEAARESPTPHFLSSTAIQHQSRRVNLPKLQLPKFGGLPKEWLEFHNMFQVLVHQNSDLSNIEKFQYLRSCLTDKAAKLIQSLEVTSENYTKAVDLLITRYNDKRYIFQSHLQEIFTIRHIQNPTVSTLREFIDIVNANLRALQSLATSQQIMDGILLQLVTSKLDPETQAKWEEETSKEINSQAINQRFPTWEDLTSFMERRCQTISMIESSKPNKMHQATVSQSSRSRRVNSSFVATGLSKCSFCNESHHHTPFKCQHFMELDALARYHKVKALKLCINCLTPDHVSSKCPSKNRCQTCGNLHHTLLHRQQAAGNLHKINNGFTAEPSSLGTALQVSLNPSQIILGTALIQICSSRGNLMQARALLDSGSQLNFITEHVAQQLRLKRTSANLEIVGIGQSSTQVRQTASIIIKSLTNEYTTSINTVIIPTITSNQPHQFIDTSKWPIPNNLRLADTSFHTPGPVDVLIGASLFFDLLMVGQIKLHDIILQKTHLGWIVAGECGNYTSSSNSNPYKSFVTTSQEPALQQSLERFWIIEEPPTSLSFHLSQEEYNCEQFFMKTFRRCPSSGKFIVRLPFKEHPSSIGESFNIASKRLSSLQNRLSHNLALKQQYIEFINEYVNLQHMKLSPAEYTSTLKVNYIPHHCVVKEDSSTTKLRVVFDASCRTSTGKSLNDFLMVGPTLQDDLITILMRFRQHAFVIMADIAKMYRQIWVDEKDTNFQCILWNDMSREPPSTYQLKTVTYGTSCAPYLAVKCLRMLAEQHKSELPIGSAVTLRDFYVDNLMSGGSTISEVIQLRDQVITLLNHGGFPLRRFASNNPEILEGLDAEEREETVKLNGMDYIKALGIKWSPAEDCFLFYYSPPSTTRHTTKRIILSHIAAFFDPLGLLNPIIVTCKMLMQQLWKLKVHWDESVPQQIATEWEGFKLQMANITQLKIPRFVPMSTATQIHIFADASSRAFGACAYAVTKDLNGVASSLLCAKSRIAPTREVSIPRLELCAALLASELVLSITTIYNLEKQNIHCWSDSKITLSWIAGEPSRWNVFVANRVAKIQHNTKGCTWYYVPSSSNPADLISRGSTVSNLIKSNIWFRGPEFLNHEKDQWPPQQQMYTDEIPEQRRQHSALIGSTTTDIIAGHKFVNRFGKLCRIFAYVLRFILHCRNRRLIYTSYAVDASEVNEALMTICKCIQQKTYPVEIAQIVSGKGINRNSTLLALTPFMHQGLLRVGVD